MSGQPLQQLAYTLTTADALAYEALPRELVGWRKWAFLLWLAAAGLVLALLPAGWVGPEHGWRFWLLLLVLIAIAWGLATLSMTLAMHRRARRRIPAPTSVELTQWDDRLQVTQAGRTVDIAYDTIAAVTATATHIFVTAPPEALIIPARAFPPPADMSAFADAIDRLSHDAAP